MKTQEKSARGPGTQISLTFPLTPQEAAAKHRYAHPDKLILVDGDYHILGDNGQVGKKLSVWDNEQKELEILEKSGDWWDR